jgi:hypothetical protein
MQSIYIDMAVSYEGMANALTLMRQRSEKSKPRGWKLRRGK